MATDVGIKVKVDGEKTFRTAINAINQQTKQLSAEMKAAVAGMSGMTSSEEKVAAQTRILSDIIDKNKEKVAVLSQQYDAAKSRLDELGRELDEAKSKEGDNTAEVQKAENAYNRQAAEVAKLGTQLANTNAEISTAETRLKALGASASDSAKRLKEAGENLQKVGKGLQDVGGTLTKVGSNLSKYVTAPVLAAGTAAVKLASDYDENLNKVEASFKDNAKEVKEWAKTATKQFGISESAALEATSLFGDMGTSMGLTTKEAALMSTGLAGLAGDLASFKNIGIDQAMTALKGIFTGETESLKTLGVVMTQANLKQFAADMGLVYDSMSEAEKVTLRYQYVLSKTTNAQGDYARTSDGTANSLRTLQASVENLGAAFGQEIVPMITPMIQKLTDAVTAFGELSDSQKQTTINLAATAAAVGPVTTAFGKLSAGLGKGIETAGKFATALSAGNGVGAALTSTLGIGGTIGLAVAGVAALCAGLAAFRIAVDNARDPVNRLQSAMSGITKAQETLSKNNEILKLVDQYEVLRKRTQDATLSEEEHQAAAEQLRGVLQKLSDATGGTVTSTEDLTDATDQQIEKVKILTQEEQKRANATLYANLLKGADAYQQALEQQAMTGSAIAKEEEHLAAMADNLAGSAEENLSKLRQVVSDTRADISAGLIDEYSLKDIGPILDDLENQLYDITGIKPNFESFGDAEKYFEILEFSVDKTSEAFIKQSDHLEEVKDGYSGVEETISEFEKSIMDWVRHGGNAEEAARLLGTSVQGLGYKMQAYYKDAGVAADGSDEFAKSAEGVADAADEEADALDEAAQAAAEAHKAIIDIASSAIEARYSGKDLRETYNELSSELDKLRDSGDEAAIMLAEQKLYLLDIAATNDELADGFAKMGISAKGSLTSLSQYLIDAGVSADDYLSGVQSMRDGVVNAFKSIRDENAMTASDMTAVLRDNLEVQRDWGNNLAYLWQQTSDNTVRAYINYLYEQGPQYAAAVAEFANGGYDELEAQAYLWADAGQLASDQYAAGIWMNEYLAGDAAEDVAGTAIDGLDGADYKGSGKDGTREYKKGLESVSAKSSGEYVAGDSISGMKAKLTEMKAASQMLTKGAIAMMQASAPQFRAAGVQLGGQLVAGYQSQLSGSRSAAFTMANNMISAIKAQAGQFRAAGVSAGQQAVAGMASTGNSFRAAGVSLASYLIAGLNAQVGSARNSGAALANGAVSAVSSQVSAFRAAGGNSGASYAAGISASASAAQRAAASVAKSAMSSASISGWYSVGYNMAAGIANGIYGGSSMISSAAYSAAKRALATAKSYLGIRSPSRVFRDEVGLMIGEGMAEGILASQRTVANAADSLGLSALNAVNTNMACGGAGGSVRNSTYNLTPTIYVYGAEGQNVDEIAAAVEQKINDSLIRRL